jgi:hypothetical protein
MKHTGKGQLQHHFWGEYYASIAIEFDTPHIANLALEKLNGWQTIKGHPQVISWHGKEIDETINKLATLGADRNAIASIKYSIDYGEPFEVYIEDGAEQLGLFA